MVYPCIVYDLDDYDEKYADNKLYGSTPRYQVTVIDRDPDSDIPAKVHALPTASFSRSYRADKLNHYVYTLYF